MSDPALHDVLTPERLAYLRLRASGATRDDNDQPFLINRSRDRWLVKHGYGQFGPPAPPVNAKKPRFRKRFARVFSVTAKGIEALRQAERRTA